MERIYRFELEPYLRRMEVKILTLDEQEQGLFALLDDTILYPEGGGQPSDRGWLGGVAVTEVRRVGGELRHRLEARVDEGTASLELDWRRRYDHMQQHTAQHLLSSVALNRFGWQTRSFHIGPEVSDIELGTPPPAGGKMAELEGAVAELVESSRAISARRVTKEEYASLEVRSRGLPAEHEGRIRLVEIDGVDLNTCGGTHLASTAEVGGVKLIRAEPLRGGCRLHWVAGRRMLRRLGDHEARNSELRSLLDAGEADFVSVVGLKLEQLATAQRRSRRLEGGLADRVVADLLRREGLVSEAHFDDEWSGLLAQVARRFVERGEGRAALLTASGEGEGRFALVVGEGGGVDLRALGDEIAGIFEGRGGGAKGVYQGNAGSLERRGEALAVVRRALEGRGAGRTPGNQG